MPLSAQCSMKDTAGQARRRGGTKSQMEVHFPGTWTGIHPQDLWSLIPILICKSSVNQWNAFLSMGQCMVSIKGGKAGAEQRPIKETMTTNEASDGSTGGIMKIQVSQDKNSSFYPSNHVSSGCKRLHLHNWAGCNQGLKREQAICSPPNSTSVSPLIIPSTHFPSSLLSHLSSVSSPHQSRIMAPRTLLSEDQNRRLALMENRN